MAYSRTVWQDKIKDETGQVIQEGTPLSAQNLNNIEAGIEENTEQLFHIEQKVTDKIIEFEGNNSQIINEFKEYVEKKISSVIDEFSFNENGFQKFSNNFIIQWGILNGGVSQTIAFPVAFNHTCFGVQYVQQNGTSSYSCSINDVNNISFKFSTQAARSNVWAWVAIGY